MQTTILMSAVVALVGYLLGSISFAILIMKLYTHKDIRDFGSGNAGMTNILRTLGKKAAALTLIGDLGKGVLAVVLARWVFSLAGIENTAIGAYVAGFFALIGHIYPLYFGFKGGKGILVSAGVILVLDPLLFPILIAVFLITVIFTKIVSLSSLVCCAVYPIATYVVHMLQGRPALIDTLLAVCISLIVVFMHRSNIKRLLNGTEARFGQKKK